MIMVASANSKLEGLYPLSFISLPVVVLNATKLESTAEAGPTTSPNPATSETVTGVSVTVIATVPPLTNVAVTGVLDIDAFISIPSSKLAVMGSEAIEADIAAGFVTAAVITVSLSDTDISGIVLINFKVSC